MKITLHQCFCELLTATADHERKVTACKTLQAVAEVRKHTAPRVVAAAVLLAEVARTQGFDWESEAR